MIDVNSVEMHGIDVKDKAIKLREQACNNYEDFIKSINIAFPEDYYALGDKGYIGTTASRQTWDDARDSFLQSHTDSAWWFEQDMYRDFGGNEWWETQLLNEMSKTENMSCQEFLNGCNYIFSCINHADRNPDCTGEAFCKWEDSFNDIVRAIQSFGIFCRVEWRDTDDDLVMPEMIEITTEQWLLDYTLDSDGTWTRGLSDNTFDSSVERAKRRHNPSHTISIRQGLKTYYGAGRHGYDD